MCARVYMYVCMYLSIYIKIISVSLYIYDIQLCTYVRISLNIFMRGRVGEDTAGDLGLLAIDFKDGNVAIAVDFVARRMPHRVARTVPVHLRLGLRRDEYV